MLPDCAARPIDPERPVALLADLHANFEATMAVDRWLLDQGIEQVVVLGDLVGYGASPREVIELVAQRRWICLRGNHEEMLLGLAPTTFYAKDRALHAIEWSARQLAAKHRDFLTALPTALELSADVIAVHGSITDPRRCYAYIYDLSLDLNIRRLTELDAPAGTLVLHGHTHRAAVFRVVDGQGSVLSLGANPILLERGAWHFVNPGSVGYPRDGDPRSSFFVLHLGARTLEAVRLSYDVAASAERIRSAGYEATLPERLLAAR